MPQYWMITNRNVHAEGMGRARRSLTFWTAQSGDALDQFTSWKQVSPERFRALLLSEAGKFPLIDDPAQHEQQQHVSLFIHGYDNDWQDAARRYQSLCGHLYSGAGSLGLCVLFTWPSDGMKTNYLPDRKDAAESGSDLAEVLTSLYDALTLRQAESLIDVRKLCRAKTSVIAHSMGNYVLQKAMQVCWTRRNQPLLMSLVNQLVMVAADVDNDLFRSGEQVDKSDGDAIANLTYRITALYSGRDPVLGLSAGLKHFGKRRLGRSGLDRASTPPDNVWDVDCSPLIPAFESNVHSCYFEQRKILTLLREVLRGVDRGVLQARGLLSR